MSSNYQLVKLLKDLLRDANVAMVASMEFGIYATESLVSLDSSNISLKIKNEKGEFICQEVGN